MKKVLQISTVYGKGSVGRIMADLYQSAENSGFEPYVAASRNDISDGIRGYRIGNSVDFIGHVAADILFDRGGFASRRETQKFLMWVDTIKPDLIHIHNIHGFYLQIEELFIYIKEHKIPVVWTLHDCWPLTGHCAYFDYIGCDKWKRCCEHCPQHLQAYPYSITDYSRNAYLRKKNAFTDVENLTIVTPSRWLADIVGNSFLKEYSVEVIPNGIDLDKFHGICNEDRNDIDGFYLETLKKYSIPSAKKIILGVANVWTPRKGFEYFIKLADMLDDSFEICLVGVNEKQRKMFQKKYEGKIIPVMHTDSVDELAALYNRADVFVNPTLEDNFPTTNIEALACGTPVVTFRTGGSPEIIEDCNRREKHEVENQTDSSNSDMVGLIVDKGNIDELYKAIISILSSDCEILSSHCIECAKKYNRNMRFEQYMELYYQIC